MKSHDSKNESRRASESHPRRSLPNQCLSVYRSISKEKGVRRMTKEELAARVNGRQYPFNLTKDEVAAAKANQLVVIYGESDDLMELEGAIYDEVGACDGGECYIKKGKLIPELDDETEIEVLEKHGVLEAVQKAHKDALKIEAKWCPQGSLYSWEIVTAAPHAAFDILESADKFCRGIVIDLKDAQ